MLKETRSFPLLYAQETLKEKVSKQRISYRYLLVALNYVLSPTMHGKRKQESCLVIENERELS